MTFSQACVSDRGPRLEPGRPNAAPARRRAAGARRRCVAPRRASARRARRSYGAWDFAEPLERLLKSYRDEAELTTLGRITVRELIVSLLDNLLRMEAERAANPSIEQQRIAAPVFIIGLPRTGTTHLHGLDQRRPGESRAADVGGHVSGGVAHRRRRRARALANRARGSAGPIAWRPSSCASIRSRPTCRKSASRSRRKCS